MQSERWARQRASRGGCEAQKARGRPSQIALVLLTECPGRVARDLCSGDGSPVRRWWGNSSLLCRKARCRRGRCADFSAAASGAAWTRDSGARHADASTLFAGADRGHECVGPLRVGRAELPRRTSDSPDGPCSDDPPVILDENLVTGAVLNKRSTPGLALACRATW